MFKTLEISMQENQKPKAGTAWNTEISLNFSASNIFL